MASFQQLDREFVVHRTATTIMPGVASMRGPHQQVAVLNTGSGHRIALGPQVVTWPREANQKAVEIQAVFLVTSAGDGKPARTGWKRKARLGLAMIVQRPATSRPSLFRGLTWRVEKSPAAADVGGKRRTRVGFFAGLATCTRPIRHRVKGRHI